MEAFTLRNGHLRQRNDYTGETACLFSPTELSQSVQSLDNNPVLSATSLARDAHRLQHPRPTSGNPGERRHRCRLPHRPVRWEQSGERGVFLSLASRLLYGYEKTSARPMKF